jgi:hypothetical protein
VLCCAVLCCAVLCCAVLCCAVLCCAVLCCAVLCCAVLCCAVYPVSVRLKKKKVAKRGRSVYPHATGGAFCQMRGMKEAGRADRSREDLLLVDCSPALRGLPGSYPALV